MLHDAPFKCETSLTVDGVSVQVSLASGGTRVSTHAIHALLDLIPTSWETTVTSRTLVTFAFRETSFLNSGLSFQKRTSPQGRNE